VDRVFLDANVLFSAAYRKASGLARLWQISDVELITSSYAVGEADRNLSTVVQRQQLNGLLAKVTIIDETVTEAVLPSGLILPEKDRPILAAAIQAHATHLLTGDKTHFGPLFGQTVGGVLIQPPATYLASRADKSSQDEPSA
jgi:predicted nucleic acid-binding protein